MNSVILNLYSYCNNFSNYTFLTWLIWAILGLRCVKLSNFSILNCLMQMLLKSQFLILLLNGFG